MIHDFRRMRRPMTIGFGARTTRLWAITMQRGRLGKICHCDQRHEESLRRRYPDRYPTKFGVVVSNAGCDILTTKHIENIIVP